MRIGILGGTFNPFHNVHLDVARTATVQLALDRLLLIPATQPPHKHDRSEVIDVAHRLAMTRLAVDGTAKLEVWDEELERPGPSYTSETLRSLKRRFGNDAELFFILGTDQLADLPDWHDPQTILSLATLVPVTRAGVPLEASLRQLRGKFAAAVIEQLRRDTLSFPATDVSSTHIRKLLKAGQTPPQVPPRVLAYIRQHHLYGT